MDPAHILARYGVQSSEASKQIDKQARGYLPDDIRHREQMTCPELPRSGESLPFHFSNGTFRAPARVCEPQMGNPYLPFQANVGSLDPHLSSWA